MDGSLRTALFIVAIATWPYNQSLFDAVLYTNIRLVWNFLVLPYINSGWTKPSQGIITITTVCVD